MSHLWNYSAAGVSSFSIGDTVSLTHLWDQIFVLVNKLNPNQFLSLFHEKTKSNGSHCWPIQKCSNIGSGPIFQVGTKSRESTRSSIRQLNWQGIGGLYIEVDFDFQRRLRITLHFESRCVYQISLIESKID